LNALCAWLIGCRGRPAAGIFLLLAQKKGTKEKGTPLRRPSGSFGLSGKLGVCATRPNSPHKTRAVAELKQGAADIPQSACQPEAAQRGSWVAIQRSAFRKTCHRDGAY